MKRTVIIIANVWNPSRGGGEPARPAAVWIENGRISDITTVERDPQSTGYAGRCLNANIKSLVNKKGRAVGRHDPDGCGRGNALARCR